ncbi:MAG: Mur ligase family protein, partial [Rhodocyclaceae bacterium]|nr:Mur ligase family protein [Rhodocyclaceae bacterium]
MNSGLFMVGVTGTNGKTSVTQWIAQAMTLLGKKCAVIGTLGNGFPNALVPGPNTTPGATVLRSLLPELAAQGAIACAMEVSSIGLHQGRTNEVVFDVAVFTNFTRDHLDYHGTMEAYWAEKSKLFDQPGLKAAVINVDDPFGVALAERLSLRIIGINSCESSCPHPPPSLPLQGGGAFLPPLEGGGASLPPLEGGGASLPPLQGEGWGGDGVNHVTRTFATINTSLNGIDLAMTSSGVRFV